MKPNTLVINVERGQEVILCIEYDYQPDFYSFIYQGGDLLTLRKYCDDRLSEDNVCIEYDEDFRKGGIIIDNQLEEEQPYAGFKISLTEKIDENQSKISIEYLGNKSALNVHRKEIWTKFINEHVAIHENGEPRLAA